jgi:uncharacterized protein YbjT (DUF2867 family)
MSINAIITGATGMVGKGVLLECIDSPDVDSILIITRRPTGIKHNKVKEIVHPDFFDLAALKDQIVQYNTCYFCAGITSAGKTEREYRKITYDLTLAFAKSLVDINPEITFCYVSGAGTDSTEKGRSMWARVKGETENALLKMSFKKAYMFRPALIQPKRGINSSTKLYNFVYILMTPFYPILRAFPKVFTTTEICGQAMINVITDGWDRPILENKDINKLGKS